MSFDECICFSTLTEYANAKVATSNGPGLSILSTFLIALETPQYGRFPMKRMLCLQGMYPEVKPQQIKRPNLQLENTCIHILTTRPAHVAPIPLLLIYSTKAGLRLPPLHFLALILSPHFIVWVLEGLCCRLERLCNSNRL